MKKLIIIILLSLLQNLSVGQITDKKDFTIGETIELQSKILNENRTVNIYLPNGYHPDSARTYPVIYLLDGSHDEDFIHVAGLVQFCSFSWINLIPETIVVGIGNIDRKKDFTYPTNNKKDKIEFPTTGGSENFIEFINNELTPLIAENYKVNDSRTLIGQSLGGLLATEILFKEPDMFDNYIIASPSLWWDDESLLETDLPDLKGKNIYVGVGKEGEVMERVAKELHDKIEKLESNNGSLFYEYFEEQNHGDVLHLAVYDAFEKIFGQLKDGK